MNQKKRRARRLLFPVLLALLATLVGVNNTNGQCGAGVTTFYVDLTGNPDSVYYSPNATRADSCCGSASNETCVKFVVTLDSNAIGINFDHYSGAWPSGAQYYQIGCGTSYQVGADICLSGVGRHTITLCKPGHNPNVYTITSIAAPAVSNPIVVSQACVDTIFATGLVEDSIHWHAVPSNATYDSYLSDTVDQDTVIVTPSGSFPSFVDYEVCGTVIGSCGTVYFCDTVRVTFVSNFSVQIQPDNPAVCFGGAPTQIFAQGSGGATPYSYVWNTGETTDTINANLGTYTVSATDSLGCTTVYDTIYVDSFSVAITASAGNDTFMCGNLSSIDLTGIVTGASGGTWYNGTGSYSPSSDSLSITYTPSGPEKTAGKFSLYLMTTGNKTCPGDTDNVLVTVYSNPVPIISGVDTPCQYEPSYYTAQSLGSNNLIWDAPGGTFVGGAGDNPVGIYWNDTGLQTVKLTLIDPVSGCDSFVIDTVYVSESPIQTISGSDTACQVETYMYSVPLQTGFAYSWSVSGGTILGASNSNTVTIRWDDTGSVSASVRVTNLSGCDTLNTLTVYSSLKPKPAITGTDSTCLNKIYTYSISSVNGHSYQWSVSGGTIYGDSTSTSIDVLWQSLGTGTVSLTQTNSLGCDTTINMNVAVLYTPTPAINAPNDSACENKIYTYSITPAAGESFSWGVSGGTIVGSSTGSSVQVLWGSPGTGTLSVTQTSSFGCDSTVSTNVTVVQTPKPVITLPNDSACQNKIYNYSVPSVAGESYVWSVSGGAFVGDSTSNSVNVLWGSPGTGTLSVTQTSAFGCDSTVSENVAIVYTPAPVINLPNDTACENKIYNYSITPAAGETFSWSVSGGAIIGSSTSDTINVLWAGAGTGTVSVTQTSPFGCDSTVSENVTIVLTPTPVITLPNDSACQNKIYNYSVPSVSGNTYVWDVSGGAFVGDSTSNSVNILWGSVGTGTVSVTQTSGFGCDSTVSSDVTIVYTPMPVISLPNDTACENKIYNYSVTPAAGETFSWSVNGGSIIGSSTGDNINVLWAGPGTGTVSVTETSSFGCDSTVSENVTIVHTPKPVITLPNDSACENKIYTYSITSVAGETYQWTVSGGQIIGDSTTSSLNVLWGTTGTGTVSVTQTSSFGCDSTVSANVTIVPTPVPSITIPNDSACQNNIYNYSTTTSAGNTYLWSVYGGQIIGDSTGSNINVLWGAPDSGSVSLTVTSSFGCDSTVSEPITIMYTPTAGMTIPNDSLCAYNTYAYYYHPQGSGETHQWSVTGGSIIGSSTDTVMYVLWGAPGMGYVEVQVTTAFGCDSTYSDSVLLATTPFPYIIGGDTGCVGKLFTYYTEYTPGHAYTWTVTGGTVVGASDSAVINVIWNSGSSGYLSVLEYAPNTCDSTAYDTIPLFPTPDPAITIPNDSACQNKIVSYSVTSQLGMTYDWGVSGGTIVGDSTQNSVNILWGSPGTGTVTITQTSSAGCDSTVSADITIVYTPSPDLTPPADTACENKIYTYSLTPSAGGESYSWSVDNGTIIGSTTDTFVTVLWDTTGTGVIHVTETSAFGCDSTISDTVILVHTPKPTIVLPNDSTCQNKIATYSVTAVAGETYAWTVSGGQIIGDTSGNSINVLWGAPGTGTINVTQTSSFGCDSTVSANVTIVYTPMPVISLPNDTACENKIYNYSITPAAGETYAWTVSGGSIIGSTTGDNINVLWAGPGTGTVTVTQTSAFGCDSTVTDSVTIVQTPKPVIVLPNDSTCQNKIANYSVTAVAGETYVWNVSGGQFVGDSTSNSVNVLWGAPGTGTISV
ncbi:MAG: hypothetical protein GC180_13400, partial [Bacteroidetes bacterium]|nr:hypothetical protein [Bacteroidota bacterium]